MLKKFLITSILFLFLLMTTSIKVMAGTDLVVDCIAGGSGCSITPDTTPLLQEDNLLPGDKIYQTLTIKNSSAQSGIFAFEALNFRTDTPVSLAQVINLEIRKGNINGPTILGPISLENLLNPDPNYIEIDTILAGISQDYLVISEMDPTAGNQYKSLSSIFDLKLGFDFKPTQDPSPTPSASPGGEGDDPGNEGGGEICNDSAPSAAPALIITNLGVNTVSLSWTSVSPVTHYALEFTRISDGATYGSTDIGNVTSYTVANLSGGENYQFQVFGVNGCAPGPRSNIAASGIVAGEIITTRPVGPEGEILGVENPEKFDESGRVEGVLTQQCDTWKWYIPWIILLAQGLLIIAVDIITRKKSSLWKQLLAALITIISIVIFYLVRDCNCYGEAWWILALLCRWYWVVSILLSLLEQTINYAFIEEVK